VATPSAQRPRPPRLRVVAYDLSRQRPVKVVDEVGDAFHIGVATDEGGDEITMFLSAAGNPELLRDIAHAIGHHPTGQEP